MGEEINVVVFGAAGGLGASITNELARSDKKYHFVIVDKDLKTLELLDDFIQSQGLKSSIVHADITDTGKIFELANVVYERFTKIDLLISCAAVLGELTPINHYNTKIWQKVIDTNLNANAYIIKAFHPLLQMASNPRAIFTTCNTGTELKAYWGAYAVSKAALNSLVEIYALETNQSNIKVSLFDPGPMPTKILSKAMPNEEKLEATSVEKIASFFVQNLTKDSFKHGNILKYPYHTN